jgi:hypothetical protein
MIGGRLPVQEKLPGPTREHAMVPRVYPNCRELFTAGDGCSEGVFPTFIWSKDPVNCPPESPVNLTVFDTCSEWLIEMTLVGRGL